MFSRETIARNLPTDKTVTAVKQAFKALARGEVQMPAKTYLEFSKYDGDLRTMPAYVPSFDYSTVKIVNAHPDNPHRYSLPTVMALIVAVDPSNGRPVAVLDGTKITSARTAAVSALATDRLTVESSQTLGIVGTGGQASDQLEGQMHVRNFTKLHLYDTDHSTAYEFKEQVKADYPSLDVNVTTSAEELVSESEVIISLTPSEEPIVSIEPSVLGESVHINAMGADAPSKREWPNSILTSCEIVVDHEEQARDSGEISSFIEEDSGQSESYHSTLGELLETDSDPTLRNKRTLFDSTGLAIQDTAAVHAFLDNSPEPDGYFDFLNGKNPEP